MSERPTLRIEPLTPAAFEPFGDVIAPASAKRIYAVNEGTARRFHDLAEVDTHQREGRTLISIFRAEPRVLPFEVRMLERHPLGSQAFIPLGKQRYLITVSESPETRPRVFIADQGEGVNYRRGTWHHPLLALDTVSDFLVVDRGGAGDNCDEVVLPAAYWIESGSF